MFCSIERFALARSSAYVRRKLQGTPAFAMTRELLKYRSRLERGDRRLAGTHEAH